MADGVSPDTSIICVDAPFKNYLPKGFPSTHTHILYYIIINYSIISHTIFTILISIHDKSNNHVILDFIKRVLFKKALFLSKTIFESVT